MFFSRKRETSHAGQEQKSIWNGLKFSCFSKIFPDEMLSTISIPILVLIFFWFLSGTAHGQQGISPNGTEKKRLTDFFEMESEELSASSPSSQSVPASGKSRYFESCEDSSAEVQTSRFPNDSNAGKLGNSRSGQYASQSSRELESHVSRPINPPQDAAANWASPRVKTYQAPSGHVVREYQNDGVLVREYSRQNTSVPQAETFEEQNSKPVPNEHSASPLNQELNTLENTDSVSNADSEQGISLQNQEPDIEKNLGVSEELNHSQNQNQTEESNQLPDSINLESEPSEHQESAHSALESTELPGSLSEEISTELPNELPNSELPAELPDGVLEVPAGQPKKSAASRQCQIPQRAMKQWEGNGLIPQNWDEEPLLPLSQPETELSNIVSSAENLKSAEALNDDFSLPQPPEGTNFEISQDHEHPKTSSKPEDISAPSKDPLLSAAATEDNAETDLSLPPIPESSDGLMTADSRQILPENIHAQEKDPFDSALEAIQEPVSPMENFTAVQCVSREDIEAGWEESFYENVVQQVTHLEKADTQSGEISLAVGNQTLLSREKNGKSVPASAEMSQNIFGKSSIKRLSAPGKAKRLSKKPEKKQKNTESEKRFDFGISAGNLEEMITSGELADESTADKINVEGETPLFADDSLIQTMNQMRSPDVLPENLLQENKDKVPQTTKKEKLELFNFGIDDMDIFESNAPKNEAENSQEPFSSSKIHETQNEKVFSERGENESAVSREEKNPSSCSMSCRISNDEEIVSIAESVSTITSVCYESGIWKENPISQVQFIERENDSIKKTSNYSVKLPENQKKNKPETNVSEEEEGDVELDFLLLSPDEFDSKSIQEQKVEAQNKVSNKLEFAGENEKNVSQKAEENQEMNQDNAPAILDFGDSDINLQEKENDHSVNLLPGEFPNEDESMKEMPETEAKAEPNVDAETSELLLEADFADDSDNTPLSKTDVSSRNDLLLEDPSAIQNQEEMPNDHPEGNSQEFQTPDSSPNLNSEELTQETANQVAEQIAEQIAEKVVEKTVDEVMRRLKNQLDEEMKNRSNEFEREKLMAQTDTRPQNLPQDHSENLSGNEIREEETSVPETKTGLSSQTIPDDEHFSSKEETSELPTSDDSIPHQLILTDELDSPSAEVSPQSSATQDEERKMSDFAPQMEISQEIHQDANVNSIPQTLKEVSSLDELSTPENKVNTNKLSVNVESTESSKPENPTVPAQIQSQDQKTNAPGFVKLSGRKKKKNQSSISKPEISTVPESNQITKQPPAIPEKNGMVQNMLPIRETLPTHTQKIPGNMDSIPGKSQAQNQFQETPEKLSFENQRLSATQYPVEAPVSKAFSSLAEAPIPKMNLSANWGKSKKEQDSPKLQMKPYPETNPSEPKNEAESKQTFTSMEEKKGKRISVYPCEGVVLNTNSQIKSVSVKNPLFCDFVELNETQLAIVGKSAGETEVQINFKSTEIEPMIFIIQVQNGNESTQLLARWSQQVEEELAQVLKDSAISVFQFQNRIFVKGYLSENVDPMEIINEIQKNFVQLRKANPQMEIPGITEFNRKMVLVNMLEKK